MRKLLDITRNDLRMIFGDSAVWFYVVIFPALFIVVLGVATGSVIGLSSADSPSQIDVIDLDMSDQSRRLIAKIQAANANWVVCPAARAECPQPFDMDLALRRLADGITQALVEIPTGFGQDLLSGSDTTVVYHSSSDDPTRPDPLFVAVQAVLTQVTGAAVASRASLEAAQASQQLAFDGDAERAAFQKAVYDRAAALWDGQPGRVAYHETLDFADALRQNGFGQSMPGMGIYGVMVNVGLGLVAIINERRNGTWQRLAVMPVAKAQILGGKILAYFLMGMLVFTVSFGIGALLGVDLRGEWLAAFLVMVAFTACMTALTLLLAAQLRVEQTARTVALMLTMAQAALGGAFWPIELVPAWMRTIGHVTPVAWAMDGFKSLIFYGGNLNTVITPVLVLLAMTAVLFVIGLRRIRMD